MEDASLLIRMSHVWEDGVPDVPAPVPLCPWPVCGYNRAPFLSISLHLSPARSRLTHFPVPGLRCAGRAPPLAPCPPTRLRSVCIWLARRRPPAHPGKLHSAAHPKHANPGGHGMAPSGIIGTHDKVPSMLEQARTRYYIVCGSGSGSATVGCHSTYMLWYMTK